MKKILIYGTIAIAIIVVIILAINFYVKISTNNQIIKEDEYAKLHDADCIIVLGAGIWGDKPSPMLEDRLLEAIKLYENNVSSKIIMSGDHGKEEYDEVNVMKDFAIEKGIPSENIFMDHAGFSTYESIYRAKEIFEAKKVVIVTQKYHLYRALYIANKLGLEAYGVASDPRQYVGATYRELREILARDKDFIKCIYKPTPTYLGDAIPVSSNGNVTNDRKNLKLPLSGETIDNVTIEIEIPSGWKYEELPKDEDNEFYKYALKLYKSQEDKNTILYFYSKPFGVCGTGRTNKRISLNNGNEAGVGYYHDKEWSDISFYEVNPNIAFVNNGLENEEAEEVLDFVKTISIISE